MLRSSVLRVDVGCNIWKSDWHLRPTYSNFRYRLSRCFVQFGCDQSGALCLFLTKAGTLIFKISADCRNFKYSDSLTRKLICFGALRLGLRFRPSHKCVLFAHYSHHAFFGDNVFLTFYFIG